jgi:23S rRNA (uracil1939-C5)-methyltransferase
LRLPRYYSIGNLISNIIEVKIESLGGLGDGIATHNGKPIFVTKSVVGDVLKVRIIHETSESNRGEIIEVLKAGEQRRDAPCPHFSACGGCSLQQMQETYYQQFKEKIVVNSMRQAGFEASEPNITFLPAASRRRAEFKLLKEHGKWSLAYLGNRSHTKVAITTCLILEPELQKILPILQELIGELPFVRDIESVSLTAADSGVEVILELNRTAKLPTQTGIFENELKHIADALKLTRISITDSRAVPLATVENGYLTMRLSAIDMHLPHDAFLQATREGQRLLTEFALAGTTGKKRILDLFCGIGTYSIAMADKATVHAADDHLIMVSNLKHAARTNNMRLTTEKRNLFVKPFTAEELKGFDAVVINPPRSGAKTQCEQIVLSSIKNVVMISCNPATFARDAKILKNAGFTLKDTLAIDQFVWSPHLEIVTNFIR